MQTNYEILKEELAGTDYRSINTLCQEFHTDCRTLRKDFDERTVFLVLRALREDLPRQKYLKLLKRLGID